MNAGDGGDADVSYYEMDLNFDAPRFKDFNALNASGNDADRWFGKFQLKLQSI